MSKNPDHQDEAAQKPDKTNETNITYKVPGSTPIRAQKAQKDPKIGILSHLRHTRLTGRVHYQTKQRLSLGAVIF